MLEKGKNSFPGPGRPRGAVTQAKIPINVERRVIRDLTARLKSGDQEATQQLALLMCAGYGSSKQVSA